MPNFEKLDARIASALNKIIHNSHFKRRISLEEQKVQKEDCFLRGRQISFMIYHYFRTIDADDTVLDYVYFIFVTLHDNVLLSESKRTLDHVLGACTNQEYESLRNLETVFVFYDM